MITKTYSQASFALDLGFCSKHMSLRVIEIKQESALTRLQDEYYNEQKFDIALQMNSELYCSPN